MLLGNDTAIQYARKPIGEGYPAGAQLFLITWHSQEDSRWFGGRIPSAPKLVEKLEIRESGGGQIQRIYSRYEGAALKEETLENRLATSRISYLQSLRAAVMP